MIRSAFEPCIPTRATAVPDRPEWIHEIKHDGYRLIVSKAGTRVRLVTRTGHGTWALVAASRSTPQSDRRGVGGGSGHSVRRLGVEGVELGGATTCFIRPARPCGPGGVPSVGTDPNPNMEER